MGNTHHHLHTTASYIVQSISKSPILHSINKQFTSSPTTDDHATFTLTPPAAPPGSVTDTAMHHTSFMSYSTFTSSDIRITILQFCNYHTICAVRQVNKEWHDITHHPDIYQHMTVKLPTNIRCQTAVPFTTIQHIQRISLSYAALSPLFQAYSDFRPICSLVKRLTRLTHITIDCNGCADKGSNSLKTCCLCYCVLHSILQNDHCNTVRSLQISNCDRTDVFHFVQRFAHITHLSLYAGQCITDESLLTLALARNKHRLQHLTHLSVDCTDVTDFGIAQIATIHTLRQLTLLNTRSSPHCITYSGICQLKQLAHLRRLKLTSFRQVDVQRMEFIHSCPFLTAVCDLTQLRVLEVEVTSSKRISHEMFQPVGRLTELAALCVTCQDSSRVMSCVYQTCARSKSHLLSAVDSLPRLQLLAVVCRCGEWPAGGDACARLQLCSRDNYQLQSELNRLMDL